MAPLKERNIDGLQPAEILEEAFGRKPEDKRLSKEYLNPRYPADPLQESDPSPVHEADSNIPVKGITQASTSR
jgi:hypothetical protein